jgi:hypothetical protein
MTSTGVTTTIAGSTNPAASIVAPNGDVYLGTLSGDIQKITAAGVSSIYAGGPVYTRGYIDGI